MNYSAYQEAVFTKVAGTGNLMVNAVAGSGKTSTCEEAIRRIPRVYNTLYTAFGRDIAAEIKTRNIPCNLGTYNSIGWRVLLKQLRGCKLVEDKTAQVFRYKVCRDEKLWKTYLRPAVRLVGLLKANLVNPNNSDTAVRAIATLHHIPTDEILIDLVSKTYIQSIATRHIMDFDDQVFMPIFLDLNFPAYDFVFADEFQDTSLMQAEMLKRMARMGRFVGVGDPDQAIYSFRGATPDAFGRMKATMMATELPLSVCYRCSEAVVREAKKIVPRIECGNPEPGNVGIIKAGDLLAQACDRDMILCRTVAPLVSGCLKAIKAHRRACVLGKEVQDDMMDLMEQVSPEISTITDFNKKLADFCLARSAKLMALHMEKACEKLGDVQDALMAVAELSDDTNHMIFTINELFAHEGGLRFMSVHKSKGLESDNVFILRPDLLPHPKGDPAEEDRIKYVAVTRAKKRLEYVI